jgi:glycosyltransferase involved in cell wall biosynthesis
LLFKNKQEPFATWMSRRFENMVTAYCHPSCTAVLFWTQATKKWALTLCRKLAPQIEALLEQKSRVIYFVPRPRPRDIVERKWAGEERNVLFCGREFEQKNGAMALRIFSRLIDHTPSAHFIYIGNIPAAARRRHAKLFERMEYYESLSRRDTIPLFERSHVLFHPSRVESYGAVYVEAAASGLAIVTAKGRLMEHVPEIVHERGSCIVDRNSIHGEEEEELAFEYHLAQLTADRPRAESMGWQNYREITDGRLCWRRMCQELGAIYRESGVKAQSGEEGLKLDDLPYSAGGGELRMTLSEIMKDHDYWRAAWDLSRQAIIFDGHDAIS